MSTTATAPLAMTGTRWRLLNALHDASTPLRAATLLSDQDATDDDLRWLAEAELVFTTFFGREVRLDLLEHLAHHGSTMVIALRLNSRGRRAIGAWQNRVLRTLFAASGHKMSLRKLLEDAAIDASQAEILCRGKKITVAVRATGEVLAADDMRLLPVGTLTAKLTAKGRTYLPLDS